MANLVFYKIANVEFDKSESKSKFQSSQTINAANGPKTSSPVVEMPKINGEWKVSMQSKGNYYQFSKNLLFDFALDIKNEMIFYSGLFQFDVGIIIDDSNKTRICRQNAGDEQLTYYPLNASNFVKFDTSKNYLLNNVTKTCLEVTVEVKVFIKRKLKTVFDPNHEFVSLTSHWTKTAAFCGLRNGLSDLSDFTFKVDQQEFKVHKLCLAAASDVMRTMFVTNLKESLTNSTKIVGIESNVFEILLHFIYGDKKQFTDAFKTELAFKVFAAAHQYDIKHLMNFCLVKIFSDFTAVDYVVETYSFACLYDILELKSFCWEVIQFDILKFFMPMAPAPAANIEKYLKNMQKSLQLKKKNEQSVQQNCQDLFSHVNLDKVLKASTLKQYKDEAIKNIDPKV